MNTKTRTHRGPKLSPAEVEARKAERAARIAALEAAAESFELDEDDRAMMRGSSIFPTLARSALSMLPGAW